MLAMSDLDFKIRPSPETNDHEVRVLVDGRDVLGEDYLGIDPHQFFAQFSNPDAGHLLIGRCRCGEVGCGDYRVSIERGPRDVKWHGTVDMEFDLAQYEEAVRRASNDFSWEDQKRRAERLTDDILRGCRTPGGFTFGWASARIAPNVIMLSFVRDGDQKMLQFTWDGVTDESATRGAERLKKRLVTGP
jgi:hypothetical protein